PRLCWEVVQQFSKKQFGDCEWVLALHFPGPSKNLLGRPGRFLGAQVQPRGRRDAIDLGCAAGGALEDLVLLLGAEVIGRVEPALEPVTAAAEKVENDHMCLILQ